MTKANLRLSGTWSTLTSQWEDFWASPVDTEWGWKDWCKSENFCVSELTDAFVFELKDGAKVFEINSGDDVLKMPMQSTDLTITVIKPIDFEAMLSQGVDAIEFNYTLCPSLYWELYGWDCDSLLVLNPDIIVSTE